MLKKIIFQFKFIYISKKNIVIWNGNDIAGFPGILYHYYSEECFHPTLHNFWNNFTYLPSNCIALLSYAQFVCREFWQGLWSINTQQALWESLEGSFVCMTLLLAEWPKQACTCAHCYIHTMYCTKDDISTRPL